MGKVRVKTIGIEEAEEAEKKKAKVKKEARLAESRQAKKLTKVPGMKGGERVKAVGPTEEELANVPIPQENKGLETPKKTKSYKKARIRSSKYQACISQIDKNKKYSLPEAIELLKKIKYSKFDETVELHINTTDLGVSGIVMFPHGTGKEIKVAIADKRLISEIEKGKIDFDVLIAEPSMMPFLGKVARILGPRGLMPNPKNGTVSDEPEETVRKFQSGQIRFRTENNIPVIHLSVGKTSFDDKKLSENITAVISAVNRERIKKITLSSTMSPGIRLAV